MTDDLTGKTLGPFRIERRLGQGAMGAVYVGVHQTKGSRVAVKVVLPAETKERSDKLAARFEREIKLLSQFRHPNIVRFYGASEDRGIRFYAMELVEGKSLDDILDEHDSLPLSEAVKVVSQICEALQELHSTGVIHRDLKPGNVLVGDDGKVKLTDFGIARDTSAYSEERLTKADHTVGTIAYMSPEQLTGQELTRKSDLYSLGLLFYRIITGRLPFIGETMFEYMQQRQKGIFPSPSSINRDLPTELDSLMRELLAQDPNDRPKDAYVVMHRLMELTKGTKPTSKPKVRPLTAVLDTVDMKKSGFSTLLSTVFGSRDESSKKTNRRSSEDTPPQSILDSPWILILALVVVGGFTTYMLWPLSDEEKFRRGSQIIRAADAPLDEMIRADQEFLEPILARNPESLLAPKIMELRDQIELTRVRGRTNLAKMTGVVDAKATEAEKQFVAALRLETLGDQANAQARYESVVKMFSNDPASRAVVALATENLRKGLKFASDDERIQAKRRPVKEALEEVRDLRKAGKLKEALEKYAAIEQLYGSDSDVVGLIEEAGVEFLSVEDLFTRGEILMASSDPADWKRAFEIPFAAVLSRSPSSEMVVSIDRFRDKWMLQQAMEQSAKDLRIGLPPDAPAWEVRYVTGLYLREELGDDLTCVDVWKSILDQEPATPEERGWHHLAQLQIEKQRVVSDQATRDSEKRALAERAWSKLAEKAVSDPDAKAWQLQVQQVYSQDKVTQDIVTGSAKAR
jgi:eukaryotic-like serine/threonine-protein kinase